MALTDVDTRRADLNAAIANYTQTRADFAEGTATQTDVDNAKVAAQQAGDALAKEMGATKAADPSIPEDDFFSNPGLQNALVRDDVRNIMTTGQFLGGAMKLLVDTEGNAAGATNVILSFASGSNVEVDWGDSSPTQTFTAAASHDYATPGVYEIQVFGLVNGFTTPLVESRKQLKDVIQWGGVEFASMERMFERRSGFTISASDKPTFLPGARLYNTFLYATDFNSPIGHWDVSNVVSLYAAFQNTLTFNQDLSAWDVSGVTNMDYTFKDTRDFNQPLNAWDVSNVIRFRATFEKSVSFNQPLDQWDTAVAEHMYAMFYKAEAFNRNISGWNVSNVTEYDFFAGGDGGVLHSSYQPNFT